MQTLELTNEVLAKKIEQIHELIEELQYNQTQELMLLQKNHATYMKKLDKLQEYNKIEDMTNQLFEKRLLEIESNIKQINGKLNNN